jgi:hypothetical protein
MGRFRSGSAELATPLEDFDFLGRLFDAFLGAAGFPIRGSGTGLEPLGSVSKFKISTPRTCDMSTDSGIIMLESIPLHS